MVAFAHLVWVERIPSDEQYIRTLNISLSDDFLFKNIDEGESDASFCRAFVSLFVRWIINADTKFDLLTNDQYLEALDRAVDYIGQENDRRGFVYGKGTVHTVNHGNGMMVAFIENPKFPLDYTNKMLDCVKRFVVSYERFAGYDWSENFLARIVASLLAKGVGEDAVKSWVEGLMPEVTANTYTDEHYYFVRIGTNIHHFLMCLYFLLKERGVNEGLRDWISQYTSELMKKVYS